jgi:hypothetical protein
LEFGAMDDPIIHTIGYLASVRRWRLEASALRELADRSYLSNRQRDTLLREAEAADRQAEYWLDATTCSYRKTRRE